VYDVIQTTFALLTDSFLLNYCAQLWVTLFNQLAEANTMWLNYTIINYSINALVQNTQNSYELRKIIL